MSTWLPTSSWGQLALGTMAISLDFSLHNSISPLSGKFYDSKCIYHFCYNLLIAVI